MGAWTDCPARGTGTLRFLAGSNGADRSFGRPLTLITLWATKFGVPAGIRKRIRRHPCVFAPFSTVIAGIGTTGAVWYCGSLEDTLPTIVLVGLPSAFYELLLFVLQSDSK